MFIRCEPLSRERIRQYAFNVRKILSLENKFYFPVIKFLEIMPEIFPEFSFEIVDDEELEYNKFAETDIESKTIKIKNSVYQGACSGSGMDRFIIVHEIGHFLMLSLCKLKFARCTAKPKPYEDPEWQADAFAGELLVPHHLIKGTEDPKYIAKICGVSLRAAKIQLKSY